MPLHITEIHPASPQDPTALNTEWFVVENRGSAPFSARGCAIAVSRRGGRPREIGKLDPGFTLGTGEKIRLVTGSPAHKAHGTPPAEEAGGPANYYLVMRGPVLEGPGTTIHMTLRQIELCRGTYEGVDEGWTDESHAPAAAAVAAPRASAVPVAVAAASDAPTTKIVMPAAPARAAAAAFAPAPASKPSTTPAVQHEPRHEPKAAAKPAPAKPSPKSKPTPKPAAKEKAGKAPAAQKVSKPAHKAAPKSASKSSKPGKPGKPSKGKR